MQHTSLSEAIVSTMNKPVLSKKEYFIYLKWKHVFYTFKAPSKKYLKKLSSFLDQFPEKPQNKIKFEWRIT
jgi:hypothetical protein